MTDTSGQAKEQPAPQAVVQRRGGRQRSWRPEYLDQSHKLALLGADNQRIAEVLGIHRDTLDVWLRTQDGYSDALNRARDHADADIAASLYQRGRGYVCKQQRPMVLKNPDGSQRIEIVEYLERFPPDTAATIFWLKNRQPQHWRDKQDIDLSVHGQIGRLPDEDRTGKALAALQAMLSGKRPKPTADSPPLLEAKATETK